MSDSDDPDETLGTDPVRNGEPFGELGLVLQKDRGQLNWAGQTGGPADPQPSNIGVVKKDEFRTGPQSYLNIDGVVDAGDLGILGTNYGKKGEGLLGDLNNDGPYPPSASRGKGQVKTVISETRVVRKIQQLQSSSEKKSV